ncbi:MAG: hypothetical protein HBSAPP03_29640 [Phycisphaerae bacterium]|nr:MAG: hypothetical protein HBSAPP03_29640 [Phycisphaerae bacterium]
MPIIGPNPVSAVAGVAASQRAAARETQRKDAARKVSGRADEDELIASPESVDSSQAIRPLTSNDQEDAREDHEQSPTYSRSGPATPPRPRLDLNG